MNLCSDMQNKHKSLMILFVSIVAAMSFNMANHSTAFAQLERFAGVVADENGTPLAAAVVTINGEKVKTERDGSFVEQVPRSDSNRYRISADLVGYAPIDYVHIGLATSDLKLTLRQAESIVVDPTVLIQAEDEEGTRIEIPANSLVDANGNPANGPLTLMLHTFNLDEEEMPGDMSGVNSDGEIVFMESVGAFHAQFVDALGNEFNLAEGTNANISVELENANEITEAVTLWSFNEEDGRWVEEEDTTQTGNRIGGTVSHFSSWNFDIEKQNPACIKLTIDGAYWSSVTNWGVLDFPNIKAFVPSENRSITIYDLTPSPDVLYNLPPYTDVEFYLPTNAPFPFAVVNTGAPWVGPSEPGHPLIPQSPYDGCSALLHIDDTTTSAAGISGKKFHDQNGDGTQNAGEPGLANWTILLQGPNSSTISTVTDANGNYSFTDLPPVTYRVTEDLKNKHGWAQTMPATGFYSTTLTAGQTVSNLDFGNKEYQNESCVTHWDVHIPLNLPYVEFHMGVHNWTGTDNSYQIEVFPFPGLYGLTDFTTTPGLPITVSANNSESLLVRVDPKPTMDANVTNKNFQVVVTNLDTGVSFGCGGTMWNQNTNLNMFPGLGADPIPPQVRLNSPARVGILLENRRLNPIEARVEVVAMFEPANLKARANHELDVLGINGLPAGEHFIENVIVPAGGAIDFEVDVALLEDVAGVGDIMFLIDDDGDGEEDAVASILVDTGLFNRNAIIYVTPEEETIYISDTYTVEVQIDNIQNLYGSQIELNFDPTIVEVVDAYDFENGVQIQHGDFLTVDTTIKNTVDNANGSIQYAISRRGEKPGVSGSGVLARIAFRGLVSGTSPITITNAVLSDPQSGAISTTQQGGTVTVQIAAVDIQGQVILERRGENNNSGTQVCVGDICITTGDDGQYQLNDVPLGGTIVVSRTSYLSSTYEYSGTGGIVVVIPSVTLLGGDIVKDNGGPDGNINIVDAAEVGQAWNSTPGAVNWDARADVTDDGVVNIRDMVAVQFNWGETAPGPWATGRRTAATNASRAAASVKMPVTVQSDTQVVIAPTLSSLSTVNESAEIAIEVDGVSNLYGFSTLVTFDPTKVQVVDANPNETGIQIQPGEFLDVANQFVVVNQVDNQLGTIELAVTQVYPAEAKSGSGVLGTVTLEAIDTGASTIEFTELRLVDDSQPNPQTIDSGAQRGELTLSATDFTIYMPLVGR